MARYLKLDIYEDGHEAVRGTENFYVEYPNGDRIKFGSSAVGPYRRRTRLYAALCVRLGQIPIYEDQEIVPLRIAVDGKPAIAAYLAAAHEELYNSHPYNDDIAALLDVSPRTVTKYHRRILNQVKDKRIGGSAY